MRVGEDEGVTGARRPEAKRHHHVPQFYLRGFADGEQITTVRLPGDKRYAQSVRKAAAENGFYSVPGHEDGADVFEKMLSSANGIDMHGHRHDLGVQVRRYELAADEEQSTTRSKVHRTLIEHQFDAITLEPAGTAGA